MQKYEMARADRALSDEKYKQVAADVMQIGVKLRNTEKVVEQQKEQVDYLEKIREAHIKTAAESADTVSVCTNSRLTNVRRDCK